ncbi:MAG: MFS transporter [Syntrophobacterales bacterium]|jgi:MFS family permease
MTPTEHNRRGKTSFLKTKILVGATFLLVLALSFNAMLSLSSLEKLYVESIVSKYTTIGKDLQRNLEKSLRFGKNIEKFFGMSKLLEDTRDYITRKVHVEGGTDKIIVGTVSKSDIAVSVSLRDGSILYSTDERFIGTKLPETVRATNENSHAQKSQSPAARYVKHEDIYIIILPVHGGLKKEWVATAIIAFNEKQIKDLLTAVLIKNLWTIVIILACGIIVLAILLNVVMPAESVAEKFPKVKISLVMFIVIGLSQIIFTGLNTNEFKRYYLQISKEKIAVLATMLKEDIEYFLSKGLKVDKLVKMDVMLAEIITAAPELDNIGIVDNVGNPLYAATKEGMVDFQTSTAEQQNLIKDIWARADPEYNLIHKIYRYEKTDDLLSADRLLVFISTNISKEVLFKRLKEIVLDSATVLVISFLFFVELLILLFKFIEKQFADFELQPKHNYAIIRPAAFIFLFAAFISSSFLPLFAAKLYKPILGLSKDVVIGLPISAEMFFVGIAIIFAGILVDKKGWHVAFFTGIVFSTLGAFLSAIAGNVIQLIVYRGIMGFGYGLIWLSFQSYIVEHTDETQRARGLSYLVAGIFSGSICGAAVGGMLAERIGFGPVFLVGAAIILIAMLFVITFMRNYFGKPQRKMQERGKGLGLPLLLKFIFNKNMFLLLVCCSIPSALCFVGIMYYFTPLYLHGRGILPANIARAIMIYGLCMIYIGPLLSHFVDRSDEKKQFIVLSGFIAGVGLLTFQVLDGFLATAIVIFMLSLSNCFGLPSRLVFAMSEKIVQQVGRGTALGIYHSLERTGQVLGPVVVAVAISLAGAKSGIVLIGAVYLLMTLFFIFGAKAKKPLQDYSSSGV